MKTMALWLILAVLAPGFAFAQSPQAGPGAPPFTKYKNFGGNTSGSSGNGADLTEDALTNCNFTIPANTFVNLGDVFQVTLAGVYGATTDSKTVRVRQTNITGGILWTSSGTVAAATGWGVVIKFMKTGSNTQNVEALGNVGNGTFNGTKFGTSNLPDTAATTYVVSGQNTTNSVANSVTCQFMQTEYFGAN